MALPISIESQIRIQQNWEAICDDLDLKQVSSKFVSCNLLTAEKSRELLKKPTRLDQTQALLHVILASPEENYEKFLFCLREDYRWLADGLEETVVTEEDKERYIASIKSTCTLPQYPASFVGRDVDVQKLTDAFIVTCHRLVVIQAFGGQGKTALATALGHQFVARWGIRVVMADMRNVTSAEDVPTSVLLALKPDAGYDDHDRSLSSAQHLTARACREIREYGKMLLLILDNCETSLVEGTVTQFYSLLQCLVNQCSNALVLCTTREAIHLPNQSMYCHHLDNLSQTASHDLLRSYASVLGNEESRTIAARCGHVALPLHIIGYLLQQGYEAVGLIEELTARGGGNLSLFTQGPELDAHASINMTYKRLSPEVKTAYQVLSLFPSVFSAVEALLLLQREVPDLTKIRCQQLIHTLCRTSLLSLDVTTKSYSMHSLIQSFAFHETPQHRADQFKVNFIEFMEPKIQKFESEANENTSRQQAYETFEKDKENYLICVEFFEQLPTQSRGIVYETVKKLSRALFAAARYTFSLKGFQLLVKTHQDLAGWKDDAEVAYLHYKIGRTHAHLGQTLQGKRNLTLAIEIYDKLTGDIDHRGFHSCCIDLARLYAREGKISEALALCEKSADIARASGSVKNLIFANMQIAQIKAQQGKREEAMGLLQDILRVDPATDGTEDGVDAFTCSSGALALRRLGMLDEAVKLYERSLTMLRNTIGKHPHTAVVMFQLGHTLLKQGDAVGAKEVLEEALSIQEETLGEHHERTVHTLYELSRAYFDLGMESEAKAVQQKISRIMNQISTCSYVHVIPWWLRVRPYSRPDSAQCDADVTDAGPEATGCDADVTDVWQCDVNVREKKLSGKRCVIS